MCQFCPNLNHGQKCWKNPFWTLNLFWHITFPSGSKQCFVHLCVHNKCLHVNVELYQILPNIIEYYIFMVMMDSISILSCWVHIFFLSLCLSVSPFPLSLSLPFSLALKILGIPCSLQSPRNKHYGNNMSLKSFCRVYPDWLQSQCVENPLH